MKHLLNHYQTWHIHYFQKNVMAQTVECKSHHELRFSWGSCHLLASYMCHSLSVPQEINSAAGSFLLPYNYCYWYRQTSRNVMPFPAHYHFLFSCVPTLKDTLSAFATFYLPLTCLLRPFPVCINVPICQRKYITLSQMSFLCCNKFDRINKVLI